MQLHQTKLEEEVAAYTKSQLVKCKPAFESKIREILDIRHILQPPKSFTEINTVFLAFTYLNKAELSIVSRVCKAWNKVSLSPMLWRCIIVFDDDIDLGHQLLSLDKRNAPLAKTYYKSQQTKTQIAISSVSHAETERQFYRALKLMATYLFIPGAQYIPDNPQNFLIP